MMEKLSFDDTLMGRATTSGTRVLTSLSTISPSLLLSDELKLAKLLLNFLTVCVEVDFLRFN